MKTTTKSSIKKEPMQTSRSSSIELPYQLLIEAIFRQAGKDIRHGTPSQRRDAIEFLRSEWFVFLSDGTLDGDAIVKQLLES